MNSTFNSKSNPAIHPHPNSLSNSHTSQSPSKKQQRQQPMASSPMPMQLVPATPATPLRIPKNAASYTAETQDYDLRSQINIQLLDTGHISMIHETLLHALHSDTSDWPSRIQAHALTLLRNGEATTFPMLLTRVLNDIKADQKRLGKGDKNHPLALPKKVIEEGVRVTRESLEQVCEVVGGN